MALIATYGKFYSSSTQSEVQDPESEAKDEAGDASSSSSFASESD